MDSKLAFRHGSDPGGWRWLPRQSAQWLWPRLMRAAEYRINADGHALDANGRLGGGGYNNNNQNGFGTPAEVAGRLRLITISTARARPRVTTAGLVFIVTRMPSAAHGGVAIAGIAAAIGIGGANASADFRGPAQFPVRLADAGFRARVSAVWQQLPLHYLAAAGAAAAGLSAWRHAECSGDGAAACRGNRGHGQVDPTASLVPSFVAASPSYGGRCCRGATSTTIPIAWGPGRW